MARKKKRREGRRKNPRQTGSHGGGRASEGVSPARGGKQTPSASQENAIRRLMSRGLCGKALARAKSFHREAGSAASDALLLDAYVARIEDLAAKGLSHEARALFDTAREKYPGAGDRLHEVRITLAVRLGDLDGLLAVLAGGNLTDAHRALIEDTIRRDADPEALARSPALPDDHPLKRGAIALSRVFAAVTSGPVRDEELALPEISRRSPLAPWKLLVRAIACFHRRDDQACAKFLKAIDPCARPARLAPILGALLDGKERERLVGSAARLARSVRGDREALRRAFEEVDRALAGQNHKRLFKAMREAVAACERVAPELVDPLRQRLLLQAHTRNLPGARVNAALRGPCPRDAHLWRLFARRAEKEQRWWAASTLWDGFRSCAIDQGWFDSGSPEEAALYLHMAELLEGYDPWELEEYRRMAASSLAVHDHGDESPPPRVRAAAPRAAEGTGLGEGTELSSHLLRPARLFERACSIHPHPENFQSWLEWTKAQESHWKAADRVALSWHEALPADRRPLLHLAETAEKRKAYKKALGYLKKAEAMDGLDPGVRRARLRLELAAAQRHLSQRRPHLAEKDFEVIESLPQAREGDRPAFLAALRWVCARIEAKDGTAREWQEQVVRLLESFGGAVLLLRAAAAACRLEHGRWPAVPAIPSATNEGKNVAELARTCALARDVGVEMEIPLAWHASLVEELSSPACTVDVYQLRQCAEVALAGGNGRLAYAASGLGLARGGGAVGRFLLLRARSLPARFAERRLRCAAAAAELARERRDEDLLEEAVEFGRTQGAVPLGFLPWDELPSFQQESLSPEAVEKVARSEREATDFPGAGAAVTGFETDDEGEGVLLEDDEDDEDFLEDFFGEEVGGAFLEVPPGIPPELIQEIAEVLVRHTDRDGEPPDLEDVIRRSPKLRSLLERFIGEEVLEGPGPGRRRGRRRKRK